MHSSTYSDDPERMWPAGESAVQQRPARVPSMDRASGSRLFLGPLRRFEGMQLR
jgi:hypothetical protein